MSKRFITSVVVCLVGLAMVASALAPTSASAETRQAKPEDLPAIPSAAPGQEKLTIPEGDFSNLPSTGNRPQPVNRSFDPLYSELIERSEHTNTYRNADGSTTKRIYTTTVNAKDAAGAWRPVDTNIVPDSTGGYRNTTQGCAGLAVRGKTAVMQRLHAEWGPISHSRTYSACLRRLQNLSEWERRGYGV